MSLAPVSYIEPLMKGKPRRRRSGARSEPTFDPEAIRGICPECGDFLISRLYQVAGEGYVLCWECRGAAGEIPACVYRRVL